MKTLILLDPDPAAWGSDCADELAKLANDELAKLLRADGYDVEINTVSATRICAETDDDKDEAVRTLERHFITALNLALAATA